MNYTLESIKNMINKFSDSEVQTLKNRHLENDQIPAAVLIPVVQYNQEPVLIYTRRSDHLPTHRGQVSFPGGAIEENDDSPLDAALRETCEEINIHRKQIEIIGKLAPFDSQTGYFIYPFVGIVHDLHGLKKDDIEVKRIFCIPVSWLADPHHSRLKDFKAPDGSLHKVWFFDEYENETLWGISAKITKEFLSVIKK